MVRAALVVALGGAVSTPGGAQPAPSAPVSAVAVLPFDNLSGAPSDDWLSQGLVETVTADLERLGTMTVITVSSDLTDATTQELDELGRRLGVERLVTGSFQRIGDDIRITARLIDVATGATARSVTLDGAIDQLFALQDRVVTSLFDAPALITPPRRAVGEGIIVPNGGNGNGNGNGGGSGVPAPRVETAPPPPLRMARAAGPNRERVDDSLRGSSGAGLGILQGRPRVRATRTDTPPNVDGRLDDEVWRTAAMLSDFVQQSPLDGAPATEETEVYIAYDADHIYFGFYLHYSDPSMMRAQRGDRDRSFADDLMTVYLDTFRDQQRTYDFDINGYGVQGDGIINTGGRGSSNPIPFADRSWDALFYSGAQIVDDGYTAEMAIPFKSIRYPQQPPGVEHRWGFQIVREVKAKNEENIVWSPMSRDVQSFMGQMGVLEGMTDLSTSRNLEILPTVTTIQAGQLESSGDFTEETTPEAGLNVKYGITSNLTADFTVNPDFSQIESDRPQIDVNQRFPLFFQELRPFFLEGAEIFDFTSPINLVHTRTIIDPNFGGKLTGKVGGTTLGFLVADDAAAGKRDSVTDPAFGQNAQVIVGRARRDLYAESHVGVILTDREFLDSYSRVGGVDAQLRLGQSGRFNFVAVQSQHRDEEGNDRSGPMWGALWRHNGRNLTARTFFGATDPDFRTDVGFVRRVDTRQGGASIGYNWWPEHWIINWGPEVSYDLNYTHEGIRQDESVQLGLNVDFAKSIRVGFNGDRTLERFGGIDFNKTGYNIFANSNTSRVFSVGGGLDWGDEVFFDPDNPYLGRTFETRVFATVRPISRFTSQININTSRFTDVRVGNQEVFDVKIFRTLSTFTFTDRMLLRNIAEYNSFRRTLGLNFLLNYRLNALTVFYAGYDDHYQQENLIPDLTFGDQVNPTDVFRQTNRAVFMKIQYLFRY